MTQQYLEENIPPDEAPAPSIGFFKSPDRWKVFSVRKSIENPKAPARDSK